MGRLDQRFGEMARRAADAIAAAQLVGLCLLVVTVVQAGEKSELSDAQLAGVTAGALNVDAGTRHVTFEAAKTTASGRRIRLDGNIELVDDLANHVENNVTGTLLLHDAAQKNLQSLININAVNSQVNVLLNLNVNIDSVVEELNQQNINGLLLDKIRPGLGN